MTAPAGVSHPFQSTKTEQSDSTLVGPNEWNQAHIITDPFAIPSVAAPANPAANNASLQSFQLAGRDMLGGTPATGSPYQLQPFWGRRKVSIWVPRAGAAVLDYLGNTPSSIGTVTARSNGPTPANLFASLRRVGNVSAGGANSICGFFGAWYDCWRGNAAGQGGFHLAMRWGISDAVLNAAARMFVGLASNLTPTDVDPSTLTQILGVGCNSGDTVMQLYSAGTAAQARTSLGANFPVNTVSTDVYELHLYCQANDTKVGYTLNRYTNAGGQITPAFTVSGTVTGTTAQLIAAGTMFMPYCFRTDGGTATATAVDMMGMYLESDF